MSRTVVFDLGNKATGELVGQVTRGWMVYGNPGVDGSGQTTIDISDAAAAQPWLQLGRMVLVQHPSLPAWAGVIDTPWQATSPVRLTLYNAEYLLSLRFPETSVLLTGTVSAIASRMIGIASSQEELFISLGKVSDDKVVRTLPVDNNRTVWDQLRDFLEKTGHELIFRPERDADNKLVLYADIGRTLGADTGFLLDDGGKGKNMTVTDAAVNGKLTNRVKGVSGQGTADDQLQSDVYEDQASQDLYRTRSEVVQFKDVTEQTALNDYARLYLAAYKRPFIDLTLEIQNHGSTFANIQPGNRVLVHSSKVRLPGGVQGWRGIGRILVPVYDETKDVVVAKVRGVL